MILQTERLILREYALTDFGALRVIHNDPEVQALRGGYVLLEQETRDEITYVIAAQQEQPRIRFQWIIERQANAPEVIGYCRLVITSNASRSAEIGYFLKRDAWGNGYATEAALELLKFGFSQLRLHRITAGCIDTNTPSAHVMEKIGMRREGVLREDRWFNGQWHDTLLYAILEQEWNHQ